MYQHASAKALDIVYGDVLDYYPQFMTSPSCGTALAVQWTPSSRAKSQVMTLTPEPGAYIFSKTLVTQQRICDTGILMPKTIRVGVGVNSQPDKHTVVGIHALVAAEIVTQSR